MKSVGFGISLPLLLAALVGFGGCSAAAKDGAAADESALTAADLDDGIAKALFAGNACQVTIGNPGGPSTSTAGSGACPVTLSAMLAQMKKKGLDPRVFVVSEEGDRPASAQYRFVIGGRIDDAPFWLATVGGATDSLEGGVEAMGFSPSRKAWAYYRVSGSSWTRFGDGTMVKAKTPAELKERQDAVTRALERNETAPVARDNPPFECVRCHSTGAPLMKELHDSWANWDSTWFSMEQPERMSPLFKELFEQRQLADDLEVDIVEGIQLHSDGRVARAEKDGNLAGVLAQLMCEGGEPSIIGVHGQSAPRFGKVETFDSMIPTSLLLSSLWKPPTVGSGQELGLDQALGASLDLETVEFKLSSDAYSRALEANGQTIGGEPGDAMFAMASPQASFADLDAVQALLRKKLIDRDIVADILMTDPTVSSFSKFRCDLAATLPATWTGPANLRTQWVERLASSSLPGAKGLRARLENTGDFDAHVNALNGFIKACADRDDASLTTDLVKLISQRRKEFTLRYGDVGQGVVESRFLIPKDRLGSTPHALRLGAKTCTLEKATPDFLGADGAIAAAAPSSPAAPPARADFGPVPKQSLDEGDALAVAAQQLNCRREPGTGGEVLRKLVNGERLTVLMFGAERVTTKTDADGRPWVFVETPARDEDTNGRGKRCWVSAQLQFVQPR
jgi:hypothetical protein